ncbi:MAG TPA: tetratricopeptide repeat protein [Thermoanaerobaculia bacterium]|jgi:tetratricopeptide (TPR) repeat protein|nr:tetratricopeptide repeat protein [Thermoanaerobaculia bacterium]
MADLSGHFSQPEFENALRGVRHAGVLPVRHLLSDCAKCRQRINQMGWRPRRWARLFGLPVQPAEAPDSADDYNQVFDAAEQVLNAFFAVGKPAERSPDELMAGLALLPRKEQAHAVRHDSRFASLEMVRHLGDLSHASRFESPARMLHLSNLSCLAAEGCTVEAAGSARRLADCRARAWGHHGNALRASGRLQEAEEALAKSLQLSTEGTGDPPLRAKLLEQTASLRTGQRQLDMAVAMAQEAGRIYREMGETQAYARTLVLKAIALFSADQAEAAARVLKRAIPLIGDQEREPHQLLAACHNLARCYLDLDRREQALSTYCKAKPLYQQFSDPLAALRAAWQEGQLLRDLGDLNAAEETLLRTRQGYRDRGLVYEAALVSLDLATVYLKLGDVDSLYQELDQVIPVFKSLGVDREALAVLLQLYNLKPPG